MFPTLEGGLTLARRPFEQVEITTASGERIVLTVLQIRPQGVKLHFAAPESVRILRSELIAAEPTAA